MREVEIALAVAFAFLLGAAMLAAFGGAIYAVASIGWVFL